MKNDNIVRPTGLKGNEQLNRMKELMGGVIKENVKNSVVELTKLGPDGKVYGIVRENHEYYIKISDKSSNLVVEDFNYIGGLKNKKSEAYPTYAKATKQLNLKFLSLNESFGGGRINVFEDDNLLVEVTDMNGDKAPVDKKTSGDNLDGDFEKNPSKSSNNTGNPRSAGHDEEIIKEEEDLTDDEKAIDSMITGESLDPVGKEDDDVDNDGDSDNSDDYLKNKRLKIGKAINIEESEEKMSKLLESFSDADISVLRDALGDSLKKKSLTETKADGMSTGLFKDEEDGYALDETKYKLKLGTENPEPTNNNNDLAGLADMGGDDDLDGLADMGNNGAEGGSNDKPFDDTPFDAGVEADEDSDPKKYIQQLAGKLGQSLRKFTQDQGSPDLDLEKFAINSVISATHSSDMDDADQKDIISKIKNSGKDVDNVDVNVDVNTDKDTDDDSSETNIDDTDIAEEGLNLNFNDGEDDTPVLKNSIGESKTNSLEIDKKSGTFVVKSKIIKLLNETQDMSYIKYDQHGNTVNEPDIKEAPTKPTVIPETKPDVSPSRRQRPWRVTPMPSPQPKAKSDNIMTEEGSGDGRINSTKFLDDKLAIINVHIDGKDVDMKFENTGESKESPNAFDKPWLYTYKSIESPTGKEYSIDVEFFGEPDTHLEVGNVHGDYIDDVNEG